MYSKLNFLDDTLTIMELNNNPFVKSASPSIPQFLNGLYTHIQSKASEMTDFQGTPEEKDQQGKKAVINFLAPGAAFILLKSCGLSWVGILVGLCMSVFKIDVADLMSTISSKLLGLINEHGKLTSDQVKSIVDSNIPSITSNEPKLETKSQEIIEFKKVAWGKSYDAGALDKIKSLLIGNGKQHLIIRLLRTTLGWFFIILLSSFGFMAAGSAIRGVGNFVSSKLNPGDSGSKSTPSSGTSSTKLPVGTPNAKFKIDPAYQDVSYEGRIWQIPKPNTINNIINTTLDFVEEVYPELSKIESKVSQTRSFKAVVEHIKEYNDDIKGSNSFFIPPNYKSKKQMADFVIKDLA